MKTTQRAGIHVVEIDTEALYDDLTVQNVHREINQVLDTNPVRTLVLDFARVNLAGSAGLSMLVRLKTECAERGCHLGLCGMNSPVREVMRITKLDGMFRICDGADQFLQGGGLVA